MNKRTTPLSGKARRRPDIPKTPVKDPEKRFLASDDQTNTSYPRGDSATAVLGLSLGTGIGMALGAAGIGVVLGIALGNIATGVTVGVLTGVVIGPVLALVVLRIKKT